MKSQEEAIVGLYEIFADGENVSEVYCSATKTKQAKVVWNEAKLMLKSCEELKGKYKIAYGQIVHLKSDSFMEALSKEDGKTGDGSNVQLGIVDEYHQHATSEMLDMLNSGKNARRQPLIMIITTAGYDLNVPCYTVEYRYASQILDPNSSVTNDKYYVMIQELDKGDDVKDERNWFKANPILCSYKEGLEGIRDDLKEALAAPEKMRTFLTKDMNVWIQQRESGYMNMQKWSECKKDFTLADFEGEECIGGLDLSTKLDLTSIALEFKRDEEYYGFQHSFMPDETYQKRLKDGRYPYDVWVQEGNLTVTPGAVIDYAFVKKWIEDNKELYNLIIKEVVYDPYNATQFVQEMEQDGYIMVECRQGPYTLNEPTKDLRDNVYNNTFHHNGDGLLTFAMGNAVTKLHAQEFVMLDKAKSVEKIDPAAALIDAHYRGMVVLGETEDIFYSPDM